MFDRAYFLAQLGGKGLFRSANVLQIADVFRRVVFLLFLLHVCFWPIARRLLPRETSEMFRHFVFITKATQPRRQGNFAARLTSSFHISQTSSKFGRH